MGCYIWYTEEGTGRGRSPPWPLLAATRWHHRRPDALPAVSSERCRHIRDGNQAMRSLSRLCSAMQLHWLPVRQHVVFKIATLVYWSLSSNAPGCLADDCQLVAVAGVRQLRSADTRTLVVSRTRSSFEDRTFAAAGPLVWNSMPPNLRLFGLSVSYGQFRRLLKTFLFGQ